MRGWAKWLVNCFSRQYAKHVEWLCKVLAAQLHAMKVGE